MKFKRAATCSAALLAFAMGSGAAMAGPVTTNWDFYSLLNSQGYNNTDIGSTSDFFIQGSQALLVASVSQMGSPAAYNDACLGNWCSSSIDLWAKNGGTPSEQGLGLAGDPFGENSTGGEIYYPNGVAIDTAFANGSAYSFTIGSVQTGESWQVLGWNDTTMAWDTLGNGTGGNVVNLSGSSLGGYTYYIVTDPSGQPSGTTNSNDIVLMSMTTVPEPGTLAFFAAGLLGCAFFVSRRRRARQS